MILEMIGYVILLSLAILAVVCIGAGVLYMANMCKEYWEDLHD